MKLKLMTNEELLQLYQAQLAGFRLMLDLGIYPSEEKQDEFGMVYVELLARNALKGG